MDAPDMLKMEREDEDVMKDVTDYAAGLMSAGSSWWSSVSGAAGDRLVGDSDNYMIVAHEERRSMTNKIEPHGEFVDRSPQTMW